MSTHDSVLAQLRGLSPKHFEQCLADIWQERQGWATEVTQGSRDRGVDVVGQPPGRPDDKTALQAKRYAAGNKITSEQIQQYAALEKQYSDITGVTVVTTSSFTTPALELAERLDVRTINGEQLARLIDRWNAEEIVDWYAAGKPREWSR